jgi:hypothetical protein
VYAVGSTFSAVRFNTGSLEAVGNPVPVMEGVASAATAAANYAIDADGSLLYVRRSAASAVRPRTLVWVNRRGQEEPIAMPPPRWTPKTGN